MAAKTEKLKEKDTFIRNMVLDPFQFLHFGLGVTNFFPHSDEALWEGQADLGSVAD